MFDSEIKKYKEKIGVPDSYQLVEISSKRVLKHGQDTDVTTFDVFNEDDKLVGTYEIHDSTAQNVSAAREIHVKKIS